MGQREEKCLDAVIRYLERKLDVLRSGVQSPEIIEQTPRDERIDCSVTLGATLFALEHTQIEPFEGHNRGQAATARAEIQLRNLLSSVEYPGAFDVLIDAMWLDSRGTQKRQRSFIGELAELIRLNQKLILSIFGDVSDRSVSIGILHGNEVYVQRNFLEENGGTPGPSVGRLVANIDDLRMDRFRRSIDEKLPKLEKWADRAGAQKVLILENRDPFLTNWDAVADLAFKTLGADTSLDYLFQLDTVNSTWRLFPIIENRRRAHRLSNGLRRVVRFNPDELNAIFK